MFFKHRTLTIHQNKDCLAEKKLCKASVYKYNVRSTGKTMFLKVGKVTFVRADEVEKSLELIRDMNRNLSSLSSFNKDIAPDIIKYLSHIHKVFRNIDENTENEDLKEEMFKCAESCLLVRQYFQDAIHDINAVLRGSGFR